MLVLECSQRRRRRWQLPLKKISSASERSERAKTDARNLGVDERVRGPGECGTAGDARGMAPTCTAEVRLDLRQDLLTTVNLINKFGFDNKFGLGVQAPARTRPRLTVRLASACKIVMSPETNVLQLLMAVLTAKFEREYLLLC